MDTIRNNFVYMVSSAFLLDDYDHTKVRWNRFIVVSIFALFVGFCSCWWFCHNYPVLETPLTIHPISHAS